MRDPTHRGWRSNAGAVACRATRAVGLLAFAVFVRAEPLHAQGLVSWPEDDACRERYTESLDGYPAYINCLVSKMPALDSANRHAFGERYDPAQYGKCRVATQPRDTSCEPYRLRRRRQPEYWPNAGKVPPVKWPEAPKVSVYRKGMKPKEYFDALCKAEAGEFIYRSVKGVEGIYQIRPRLLANDYELRDRYVLEDPYGYTDHEASSPELIFVGKQVYRFFETARLKHARFGPGSPLADRRIYDKSYFQDVPLDAAVARFSGFDGNKFNTMIREFERGAKSRYGYTWRGISRPYDRELGVAGGEVIVIDLEKSETLGLWRGFAQNRALKGAGPGISWEVAPACPHLPSGKFPKDFISHFLTRVLIPKKH